MSQEIAVRESQSVALSTDQLKFIANTEFVPKALRGNLPAILACVATGRELGIGDMSALRLIHIIDGRPAFSAELMVHLVRSRHHSITGSVTDGSATATGRRADTGDEMTTTWTLEMAKRAGLLSKGNWTKYPEAMLWARAVSQLCRMLFADVFAGGGTYTDDEIINGTFDEDDESDDEGGKTISAAQLTRLHTIKTNRNVPVEEAKRLVKEWGGADSSKLLPRDRYEAVCAALEEWEPADPPADEPQSFADMIPEGARADA